MLNMSLLNKNLTIIFLFLSACGANLNKQGQTTVDASLFPTSWGGYNPRDLKDQPAQIVLKTNKSFQIISNTIITLKDINDSRCPKDVQCIWAGKVTANFSISINDKSENFNLELINNKSSVAKYNDLEFSIIAVNPYPDSKTKAEQELTLSVQYIGSCPVK